MILWFKALHIIFMVAWFAGIFYLPRLFVYHSQNPSGAVHEQFQIMERRLLYFVTPFADRKSTRLNSSHVKISYAVFCLKKKNNYKEKKEEILVHTPQETAKYGELNKSNRPIPETVKDADYNCE